MRGVRLDGRTGESLDDDRPEALSERLTAALAMHRSDPRRALAEVDALIPAIHALRGSPQEPLLRAEALYVQGASRHLVRQSHKALGSVLGALTLFERARDLKGQARCLNVLSAVYGHLGEVEEAVSCLQRSLELRRQLGNEAMIGVALLNLGVAHSTCLDEASALACYEEAARYMNPADAVAVGNCEVMRGLSYRRLGEAAKAEAAVRAGLGFMEQAADSAEEANALIELSGLCMERGALAEAEQALAQADALIEVCAPGLAADAEQLHAALLTLRGESEEALRTLDAALEKAQSPAQRIALHTALAELHETHDRPAEALANFKASRAIEREQIRTKTAARLGSIRIRHQLELAQHRAKQLEKRLSHTDAEFRDLQEGEAFRADLLSSLAHDLRGSLQAVVALCDLHTHSGTVDRLMPAVRASVAQLLGLAADLRDLGSTDRGAQLLSAKPVEVRAVMHQAVRALSPMAAAKEITLQVEGGADHALADPRALERVASNLIGNAIKFSPRAQQVSIRCFAIDDRVGFEVLDSGPGFSPRDFPALFERGVQLSAKPTAGEPSTGLGLYIVKGFVDAMDGTITVGNRPSGGAAIEVGLPAAG